MLPLSAGALQQVILEHHGLLSDGRHQPGFADKARRTKTKTVQNLERRLALNEKLVEKEERLVELEKQLLDLEATKENETWQLEKLARVFKPEALDEEVATLVETLKTEKRWAAFCNDDRGNASFAEFADKDGVKNLVRGLASGKLAGLQVPGTLLTVNNANQIDAEMLAALPDRYVMKATHGSGMSVIVKGQKPEDFACRISERCAQIELRNASIEARVKFLQDNCRKWLGMDYGTMMERGKFYSAINPKCIFEEFIEQGPSSVDFKVFTFHGTPLLILVSRDPAGFSGGHSSTTRTFYTADTWQPLNIKNWDAAHEEPPAMTEKPKHLAELVQAASVLSEGTGFGMVRADFYVTDDKVYFSELTKMPNCCEALHPPIVTNWLQHIWGDASARRMGSDLLKLGLKEINEMPARYFQNVVKLSSSANNSTILKGWGKQQTGP